MGHCSFEVLFKLLGHTHAGKTISAEYKLEYGSDKIEMHVEAIKKGQRVVLVDDLIATGGTMAAGVVLMNKVHSPVSAPNTRNLALFCRSQLFCACTMIKDTRCEGDWKDAC